MITLLFALLLSAPPPERDFSKVEIKTEKVTGNVHVLYGARGNTAFVTADAFIDTIAKDLSRG